LRPFPASEFPSPFYFPNFFFPFLFPLLYLPEFPFSFLPSIFPFLVTILSHFFFKMVGSRVGGLAGFHLHPYSHIMSLTDHRIILYLTISASRGFAGSSFHIPSSAISILHPKICDLHYDHRTHRAPKYLISPILSLTDRITTLSLFSTFRNHGFAGSGLVGSQKFPNPNCSLVVPAILVLFPIHI
jgi:hypothetical protein